MKKKYQKPAMLAAEIQLHIICGTPGAKSLNNSEKLNWQSDGLTDNDDDV